MFWIPATVFVIQFIANTVFLLKAIKTEETETNAPSESRSGDELPSTSHAS